jgi:DNA uptake protein ComE-like DNA-binding protein
MSLDVTFFGDFRDGFVMTDIRRSDEALQERDQDRPAFSWPGRRRADEAAEAAERAALQGLERLRGRTSAEPLASPDQQARELVSREELRALVFEASQQLRDAIKIEANALSELMRSQHEELKETVESLRDLASELRPVFPLGDESEVETLPQPREVSVDLNSASHADLCSIGMSETQASRVIRHRDFWGDFQSVAELDHVPGFSPDSRVELDERLVVYRDDEESAQAD